MSASKTFAKPQMRKFHLQSKESTEYTEYTESTESTHSNEYTVVL